MLQPKRAEAGSNPIASHAANPVEFDFRGMPATDWITITLELFDDGEMPPALEGKANARRLSNGQIAFVRLTASASPAPPG